MKFSIAALTLATLAYSQSIADEVAMLPSCSLTCLTNAITGAGCGATDYACQCGSAKNSITTAATPCIIGACATNDALKVQSITTEICNLVAAGGAGSSSSAAPASTSSAASSASSSMASSMSSSASSASSMASSMSSSASRASTSSAASGTQTSAAASGTTSAPATQSTNAAPKYEAAGIVGAAAIIAAFAL